MTILEYTWKGLTCCSDYSDFQDKVRRAVNQGFIDPEDFNGVSLLEWNMVASVGLTIPPRIPNSTCSARWASAAGPRRRLQPLPMRYDIASVLTGVVD